MVELNKSPNSCNTYEGLPGNPEVPLPSTPSLSSSSHANYGAIKAKKLPVFSQRAEAEGSPDGFPRYLKHPLSLLSICTKQKVDSFCKPKTHTAIIHQLAQVIAAPRTNTPVAKS